MADTTRVLNSEITTLLSITQRDEAGTATAVDADDTPTAEITRLGVSAFSITAEDVTHDEMGQYSFEWTPTVAGLYTITWTFAVGGDDFESEETVAIEAEVEGTSSSALPADEDADIPDMGEDALCLVTCVFYDAGGNFMEGVYLRFTPDRDTAAFLAIGIVAAETTVASDANGAVSFYLARGLTGMLAVTGLGIVRHITIPDAETADLLDIVALGDDLLTVQTTTFYSLPRRS